MRRVTGPGGGADERETSEDTKKGWDGDPGPAQNPSVAGILPYKKMFLREERITAPGRIEQKARNAQQEQAEIAEGTRRELKLNCWK